jgi:8-oxo-dGTP diphosphatase
LDIELVDILGVYSDPIRGPRGHVMSTVFIGRISDNKKRLKLTQDDAEEINWIKLAENDKRN